MMIFLFGAVRRRTLPPRVTARSEDSTRRSPVGAVRIRTVIKKGQARRNVLWGSQLEYDVWVEVVGQAWSVAYTPLYGVAGSWLGTFFDIFRTTNSCSRFTAADSPIPMRVFSNVNSNPSRLLAG